MKLSYLLITLIIVLGLTIVGVKNSWSDNDRWERSGVSRFFSDDDDDDHGGRRANARPVPAIYKNECGGSCHMVYPARLLPSESWQKLMSGLEDHFGDNAELNPAEQAEITQYLVENSPGKSSFRRSRSMMQAPLRITQMPHFRHEHNFSDKMVKDNPKVASLSNCDACHQGAETGSFNEHDVRIPGFAGWHD